MKSKLVDVNSFYRRQFYHCHRFQSVVGWLPSLAVWLSPTDSHLAISSTDTEAVKRPSFTLLIGTERESIRHTEKGTGLLQSWTLTGM